MTWKEANAFMGWLAGAEGVSSNSYRLPREMEQEKAARGALEGCRYPCGNELDAATRALYSEAGAIEVDAGPANGYGLHSATANVFTWCSDWMGEYPTTRAAIVNPKGPSTGKRKVLRGGTWWIYNLSLRCADRWEAFPDLADDRIGFRVVRELPVPADLPVWTGRPSAGPLPSGRASLRVATAAAANGRFCIEEAYRALQARAKAVGVTLEWPGNDVGAAGEYPEDGFYCASMALDPANTGSNLVQILANNLSDEGFLGNFVHDQATVEGAPVILRHSTNSLKVVTGITSTNYAEKLQELTPYIARLKKITVLGVFSNANLRESRSMPLIQASCQQAKSSADSRWESSVERPTGMVGSLTTYTDVLVGWPNPGIPGGTPTSPQWQASLRSDRGTPGSTSPLTQGASRCISWCRRRSMGWHPLHSLLRA